MNVLLDTHTIIWAISNDNQLTNQSRNIIEDTSNNCFVSMASLWEMGIKVSIGKLNLKKNLPHTFQIIEDSGFTLLPISSQHILTNT